MVRTIQRGTCGDAFCDGFACAVMVDLLDVYGVNYGVNIAATP
jgi:hypothetical protein